MTEPGDKPDTIAVSAGRMSQEHFGVINTPVYRASTVLFSDLATLESGQQDYVYGRRGTPSSRSLEEALCALEGGARTVLVPSGLNACTTAIMAVVSQGDHLLMVDSCYEPTRDFCDKILSRFGVETSYYPPTADITPYLRPNTRAVFCESPGSLTFEVQDIPAIARAAHAYENGSGSVSVLMDNTWATPLLFGALAHGVDLSIQAVTKYVGGHADLMMGAITANQSHAARLVRFHGASGLFSSGDDIFLALRGLRTLAVRLKRHQETAMRLASWLAARPEVTRILYPALPGDPGHALWKRDFKGAPGLFGLELKPVSKAGLAALMDGFSHFGLGWSWGGFESLIVPAHIRRSVSPFAAEGPVFRIHAGLEDADDLIADLERGFKRLKEHS
jgi:cysteine-S-conjugate beta-lyase